MLVCSEGRSRGFLERTEGHGAWDQRRQPCKRGFMGLVPWPFGWAAAAGALARLVDGVGWFLGLGPRTLVLLGDGGEYIDMTFEEAARHWRFGPNWPGVACGVKTRAGTPCKNPAVTGKARCRMHGGKSTGAKTPEGRAKLRMLHLKHGRATTEAKAEARRRAQVGREVRKELREIEREAIAAGLLAKDWRSLWDVG
jgi:hypothetical protein